MKYRRFMIEETRAMLDREAERLKHTLPIGSPITSPLLSYDQLRLICFSSVTVFSLTREHNQVFKVHMGFSGPLYVYLSRRLS